GSRRDPTCGVITHPDRRAVGERRADRLVARVVREGRRAAVTVCLGDAIAGGVVGGAGGAAQRVTNGRVASSGVVGKGRRVSVLIGLRGWPSGRVIRGSSARAIGERALDESAHRVVAETGRSPPPVRGSDL